MVVHAFMNCTSISQKDLFLPFFADSDLEPLQPVTLNSEPPVYCVEIKDKLFRYFVICIEF